MLEQLNTYMKDKIYYQTTFQPTELQNFRDFKIMPQKHSKQK